MKKELNKATLINFQVHPEIKKICRERELESFEFTLSKFGQQNPVSVVEKDGQFLIIDGVSRFKAATQINLPSLIYEIVDISEDKIIEYRMLCNAKTKKGIIETCFEVEYILDVIGKSQGKKRELLGFKNVANDNEYGDIGKDRFELACGLAGIGLKSSTLRKLMKVFWDDYQQEGKSKTGTLDLLDAGKISIDRAYKLIGDMERKMKKCEKSNNLFVAYSSLSEGEKPYQLFAKSSLVMDEVPDNSVNLCIDSHPYALGQREYQNQDEMRHGQERTLEGYLGNFKTFNEEKYRKLKPGGVLVTIIGESYKNGYQGVCSQAELVLKDIGFQIIDVVICAKTNQKYTPHPMRFQNSYERIIVAFKPGAEPYFSDVMREGTVSTFKVMNTSSGGYYMASPRTCIPNVIVTSAYQSAEFRAIDPEFKHDAPCPPEIYEIFIKAYSKPEDTILDSFVGSGTVGIGLPMGRKVIGYDVDPLSVEFSRRRFDWFLEQGEKNTDVAAA